MRARGTLKNSHALRLPANAQKWIVGVSARQAIAIDVKFPIIVATRENQSLVSSPLLHLAQILLKLEWLTKH